MQGIQGIWGGGLSHPDGCSPQPLSIDLIVQTGNGTAGQDARESIMGHLVWIRYGDGVGDHR